ncbi:MAG TPA: hypothetical protein VND01_00545 [Candidatus Acidoferrales bacterium]|nr:hypothetical protein [Candidatus Acidoferrales bacterium]
MRNKKWIVVGQVLVLAVAFFLVSGIYASILFLLNEVSFASVITYLEILSESESISIPVFLEGLFYYTFKKNRKQLKK